MANLASRQVMIEQLKKGRSPSCGRHHRWPLPPSVGSPIGQDGAKMRMVRYEQPRVLIASGHGTPFGRVFDLRRPAIFEASTPTDYARSTGKMEAKPDLDPVSEHLRDMESVA